MNKKKILIATGHALYGGRWQTDLARDLGLTDGRRLRQWLSEERPIPDGVVDDLVSLLTGRKKLIDVVLSEIETESKKVK